MKKDGETPVPLESDDYIEINVKTTVLDSETPRESERSTPGRKSVKGQRRSTVVQSVPFIPESPSRRTSFKLGKDGNMSMEQEDRPTDKNEDDNKSTGLQTPKDDEMSKGAAQSTKNSD